MPFYCYMTLFIAGGNFFHYYYDIREFVVHRMAIKYDASFNNRLHCMAFGSIFRIFSLSRALQFFAILVFGAISSALPYGGSGSGGDFSSGPGGGGGHDLAGLSGGLLDNIGGGGGVESGYADSYSNGGSSGFGGGGGSVGGGGFGGDFAGRHASFTGGFQQQLTLPLRMLQALRLVLVEAMITRPLIKNTKIIMTIMSIMRNIIIIQNRRKVIGRRSWSGRRTGKRQ